jgi:adenylosuccinate synthase
LRAFIVVDLGFGDSGKGVLTDFLVRRTGARLVVRYNGGAQAGHNVISPDGCHHTFSQFGSGTFSAGVRTYLSRHVVIHPAALLLEGSLLESKGVRDAFARLRICEQALVITPYHQAANRLRELMRGASRHGSCGVGMGETVSDSKAFPEDAIRAADLLDRDLLKRKLLQIRRRLKEEIVARRVHNSSSPRMEMESSIFEWDAVMERTLGAAERIAALGLVASDALFATWMHETESVVWEGAQGILLDEDAGFHPYTTWSRCTTANAKTLLQEFTPNAEVNTIGVLRSYANRHGAGPLPTQTSMLSPAISDHNTSGEWQGEVRYGWFDSVLARYALEVNGGVDFLALTHLDVPGKASAWNVCREYSWKNEKRREKNCTPLQEGPRKEIPLQNGMSIVQREKLTQALFHVTPMYDASGKDELSVLEKTASLVGRPIDLFSRGPYASDMVAGKSFQTRV